MIQFFFHIMYMYVFVRFLENIFVLSKLTWANGSFGGLLSLKDR